MKEKTGLEEQIQALQGQAEEAKAGLEALQAEKDALAEQLKTLTEENEALKQAGEAATDYLSMGEEELTSLVEALKEPLEKLGYTLTLDKKAE